MSTHASSGSPPTRSRRSTQFVIHEDAEDIENTSTLKPNRPMASHKHNLTSSDGPSPLTTSKLGNIQGSSLSGPASHKKTKVNHDTANNDMDENAMDALLAKLNEGQPHTMKRSDEAETTSPDNKEQQAKADLPSSPAAMTPVSDPLSSDEAPSKEDTAVDTEKAEMLRLKRELEAAKQQLELQKRELDQNRVMSHTLDQAMGAGVDDVGINRGGPINNTSANLRVQTHQSQGPSFATSCSGNPRHDLDNFSDNSDVYSTANFNNNLPQNHWSTARPSLIPSPPRQQQQFHQPINIWGQPAAARPFNSRVPLPGQGMPPTAMMHPQPMPQHRILSGPASPGTIGDGRFVNDFNQYQAGFGPRRHNMQSPQSHAVASQQQRNNSNNNNGWPMIGNGIDGMNLGVNSNNAYPPMGIYPPAMPYQPRPIGTPLSPTATEFRADQTPANPWNHTAATSPGQVYVQPMEPLNYRRLLDRSISCNWKYIVDKIVCNNDQQASIFLQQKLKVGTVEQKYEIIEAIVAQAYPLMVNRFGNFLVQRCFEHGTPEQVVAIANAIRGNTLSLSMDAFGCHVVQKAFDAVPEEYKAIMVHELLRRIPETVIHRYACHVWQKLFELRWSDSPPQIMKFVNEALRGMWHDVALGETGSLVVQNIFENCLEEDKRPCINEVLNNIDIVAHGQFGNWCIQHICEHGATQDRTRAIDHVLRYSTEYSMDQFASKVVEKCLKIGGPEFLERYLERVCEGRQDRPRIPLIDIASDQYGNYLIQYILTHANNTHREVVASNVRKHMVSLRGSKFGSRVGMLCCNPAYATHPGPGAGMSNTRYSSAPAPNPRFGGAYR
ncbi:MAG: hypothetical protein L6R38_004690 [Xanthoria sp. 2 TBL-2021]|nr:MAG: hypothetical protein L6R38_004690 [Xanthoria sp. 2 TBL-2021]